MQTVLQQSNSEMSLLCANVLEVQ